ncbi:MAG: hypothetical protein ACFFCQ_18455 [Promethearchaeota archaeon]
MKKIDVIFSQHSISRIKERGGDFREVISPLKRDNKQSLIKNRNGYEMIIPLKGRLVGHLSKTEFIVKSYIFPKFSNYGNAKKQTVQISQVYLKEKIVSGGFK